MVEERFVGSMPEHNVSCKCWGLDKHIRRGGYAEKPGFEDQQQDAVVRTDEMGVTSKSGCTWTFISDSTQLFCLNCFVLGDKSNEIFTVEVRHPQRPDQGEKDP